MSAYVDDDHLSSTALRHGDTPVRSFLLRLALFCLLPGILGASALFFVEYRHAGVQLERDTIHTTRAISQAVDNYLLRAQALAIGLAEADALASGDWALFRNQALRALADARLGTDIGITDAQGRQLMNTAVEAGKPVPNYGNLQLVQRVFETGKPVISDTFIGGVSRRAVTSVAVPVFKEGKPIYMLAITILPEHINALLNSQGLPHDWVVTVFDTKGSIVARTRDADRYVGQRPSEDYYRKLVASREGVFQAVMRDGVDVLAAHTQSEVTQWRVAIAIPRRHWSVGLDRNVALLGLGILILFTMGLWLAWRSGGKIAGSFQGLIPSAIALGSGRTLFPPELPVAEANEVLAAMNQAAELLEQREESLVQVMTTLQDSERRLSLALTASGTAVWEIDVATDVMLPGSELLYRMLGFDEGELKTCEQWIERIQESEQAEIRALRDAVLSGRQEGFQREVLMQAKDGAWHWILIQATAAERDVEGRATRLVGTHTDVTERKMAQERIRQAALHDPLTGLPNRALIFEFGNHLMAATRRHHGQGALLFIDLDKFKPINDLYGHETGDCVLQEVAKRLTASVRKEDMVGRLGGDEFVILLSHLDNGCNRAATVAQHLVKSISEPYRIDGRELSVTPSIGISCFPEHAADIGALIQAADLAMYVVKESGRANYQYFSPELDKKASEAQALEQRLKNALAQGHLRLHYQPIVDILSGKIVGAEALLRLSDADEEHVVGPDKFVPVAESAGLIDQLGEWVATEACRQHRAWWREGLQLTLSFNISPLQFKQQDFVTALGRIIRQSGADPARLQVEVTEGALMHNLDDAIKILDRIKALGLKVSLDDFGTGYSSLSRLSHLPLDRLKVDKSFIRRVENDPASRAVTDAILALGKSLKLEVIGEGIESEVTLEYLREHGCNQAQGYWFSRPLPAEEFERLYRKQQATSAVPA